MEYIFFPGNSISNREWINTLSNEFTNKKKREISYNHWETGDKQIDFEKELEKIKLLNIQEECIAICKSAGCYLSYLSSRNNYLNIKKFVFIGYPYLWLENLKLNPIEALKYSNSKLLIVQKQRDPVIGFEELNKILEDNNIQVDSIKYERVGEDDNTHGYEDTRYLKEVIGGYLNIE